MQKGCDMDPSSSSGDGWILHSIRDRLGGRRGLLIGGAVLAAAGLAFGWSWLTAIGLAPILIGLAPCLAMCALGLCMRRMTAAPGAVQKDEPPIGSGARLAAAPSDVSEIDPPKLKELAI